jgi:predicted nucleic acid-binding protein
VLDDGAELVTHSYVLVETLALVQRRLGLPAVVALNDALLPILSVEWVDAEAHAAAVAAVLAARRRSVSLVDHVSFALMRRRGIDAALAVDRHFAEQGFTVLAD